MKTRKIAIMGLGTVGGGTYDILTRNRIYIKETRGADIEVKYILDRDAAKLEQRGIDSALFVTDIDVLARDPELELVVETMGGVEPARSFISKLLAAGKSVVTANKELLAKHRKELEDIAREHECGLYFEASCVGGVPIIRALSESFQGDKILGLYGIINGTTNYILSKMSAEGCSYLEALGEAKKLGYAEADPTNDVEGFDAVYKLSILGSLAFHARVPYDRIYREGITGVRKEDISNAHRLGYEIKLLAVAKRAGSGIEARVHPVFVPKSHPLAAVSGAFNAVYLCGDHVGDLMFYGAGAGAAPTGSAIVSDIIKALGGGGQAFRAAEEEAKLVSDFVTGHYINITVEDKVGVMGRIASVLSANGVSICAAMQDEAKGQTAELVFLTHPSDERGVRRALAEIEKMPDVRGIDCVIRVL